MENYLCCNDQISDFTFFKKIEFKNLIKFLDFKKLTSVFLLILSLSAAIAQEKKPYTIDQTGYFGPGKTAMAVSSNQNNLLSDLSVNSLAGKTEDLSKRDAFSKHYKNNDGSYTARISSVPVNYQKDGKWNDINTTITVDKTAKNFSYSNKTNLMETSFGSSSEQGVVISSKEGAIKDFLNTKMYWEVNGEKAGEQLSKSVSPTVKGAKLFYNKLFGNISAEFTILTGERKLNYIIPNKNALGTIPAGADYLVFSEDVILSKGWTYELTAKKEILLKNTLGKVIYSYLQPQVLEKYIEGEGLMEKNNPASFEIEKNANGITIKTKVKTEWLLNSKRIFPVAVDPTITLNPLSSAYYTGWADSNGSGASGYMYIGYDNNNYQNRAYMRFDNSSVPNGVTISGVSSGVYRTYYVGNTINRYIAITNSRDPVSAPSYYSIYTSATTYLSNNSLVLNNNYTVSNFTATGVNYVQSSLADGYTAIIAAPSNGFSTDNNNFGFNGYDATSFRPYLDITYTLGTSYCTASVSTQAKNDETYIKTVRFLGTLNDVDNFQANPYNTAAPWGYQNYTTREKTIQAKGNGINVYVESNSVKNGSGVEQNDSYYMAWIDYNKDGDFDDANEQVYDSKAYVLSTTFGVIIPTNISAGDYRLRIRINKYNNAAAPSCGQLTTSGETEDYLITVIDNCSAIVTSVVNGSNCGTGAVTLKATASGGNVTSFKWWSDKTGGTLIGTSNAAADKKTTTWTTPSISSTTTYYVEAVGSCTSLVRIPVKATIKLVPNITFTPAVAESCGTNSIITLSAAGGNEIDYLIDENFEGGGLGIFNNVRTGPSHSTLINNQTAWQNLSSVNFPTKYQPTLQTWAPAISSGINGNKFVMSSSDIGQISAAEKRIAENGLVSPQYNATEYLNLTLNFDMYYSRYHPDGILKSADFVKVQVATNAAGDNWTVVPGGDITVDKGIGTRFAPLTFDLNLFKQQRYLKIRILYHGEWCDGVALDNVQLYGEKKLRPSFSWNSGANPINFYSDPIAETPYVAGTPVEAVYIRATLDQMQTNASWTIDATATLANGCTAPGKIIVANNNKIWNDATNLWDNPSKWKPTEVLPTLETCVIVRSELFSNTNALAKNIEVVPGGRFTVNSGKSLKVQNDIINKAGSSNFVVESDANLLQVSETAINSGPATVKRNSSMKRQDYTYWGSPVHNQNLKAFSPSTLDNRFSTYNEGTDEFDPVNPVTTNFIPGKGYAVRAPNTFPRDNKTYQSFVGNFVGVLNNGTKYDGQNPTEFPLKRTSNGYNLIANPYPSNIDFGVLVSQNSAEINYLAYFWTNINKNPRMQSSDYPLTGWVNNYATFNGTMGTPASYVKDTFNQSQPDILQSQTPNSLIKPGQGFIVQASTTTTGKLSFNNSIRTDNATGSNFFNNKMSVKKASVDRFWIQMTTPMDLVTTAGIGYVSGATNQFEINYDAPMMDLGSDAIYTNLGTELLAIQGREYPLKRSDVVDLGTNHFEDGIYTIAVPLAEGIFNGSQAIYLKDKETGIVTNLSENSYSYSAVKGQSDGRFELFYEPKVVLGTENQVKENLVVYREGNSFVVKSPSKKINDVEMFDSSGRLIYKVVPNNTKTVVPAESINQGVYILKINQEGEITTRKVMK